jgi:hypothetical protein
MEENNLVYVFLDTAFTDSCNQEQSSYAYEYLPGYYTKTYEYNRKKFTNSHFILNDNKIADLVNDPDFKIVSSILNEKWARYKCNPFWYSTFIRVILLCLYARNNNLKNTIHVESDNIIYADNFITLQNTFKPGEFGFCNEAPYSSAPSIIFLKDKEAADSLLKQHITLLSKGEDVLRSYVGYYGNYITDMALLDIIYRRKKDYRMLPCLPYGPFSENYNEIKFVFDPTSYGQYLGGTNNGHPKGFTDQKHYVGQEIKNNNINILFVGAQPFLIFEKQDVALPIFNLHIHNKEAINNFIPAC